MALQTNVINNDADNSNQIILPSVSNPIDISPDLIPLNTWESLIVGGSTVSSPSGQVIKTASSSTTTALPGTNIVPVANDMKSSNFISGVTGWKLGSNGIIEAVGVTLSGSVTATSGTIGGWIIGTTTLTGTGVTLSSTGNAYIAFGTTPPTSPTTGTGVFIDKTGLFGLSANTQNFKIDATDGSITSIKGSISGFNITSTSLSIVSGGNTTTISSGATSFLSGPTGSPTFSVTLAGVLTATSGTIGGWNLASTTLTGTGVTLSSTGDAYIAFGTTPPTSPTSGTGVFINKTGLFGLSSNTQNFKIDATNGNITAIAGSIGGFTITSNTLYGSTIKTSLNVGMGNTGVIMDTNGLRGYDSVLGNTFSLPVDGSAPIFSSGQIDKTVYTINTGAVIRTSSTVGDGTANSAGILFNNTGFYACAANQTLANANIKILVDGSGKFISNVSGGQTDYNTGVGYFLGLSGGLYKFSVGDPSGSYLTWDGTYLKISGSVSIGSNGILNNAVYTQATLPIAATIIGFNVPSSFE